MPPLINGGRDKIIWKWDKQGTYSARSLYNVLSAAGKIRRCSHRYGLPGKHLPPRFSSFSFCSTGYWLKMSRGQGISTLVNKAVSCAMPLHLLFLCPMAVQIWQSQSLSTALWLPMVSHVEDALQAFRTSMPVTANERKIWLVHLIAGTSTIWRKRNTRIFSGKENSAVSLALPIRSEAKLWLKHC